MVTLKTDKYELTMLDAFVQQGIVDRKAVFELFGRKLPAGRTYGVVAGTARAVEALKNFRFTQDELDYVAEFLHPDTVEYLKNYEFTGTVRGYREGDLWFPYAPLLTIESTLGEAVILETLLLSIFNYDSAVASAASMMRTVAGDEKVLMEFGSRRVNEDAAVAAARATYLAGFTATSNLEAGKKYGIPVYGTSAHAFTLAFPTEREAFQAQVDTFGVGTTLLVDTYDITEGVNTAIEVAGTGLYGVRIDSGDPHVVIPAVRKQLDALGAVDTKIVLSGDVNLKTLTEITEAGLPVDSYGIGTSVVTGDGHVASGFVYKLVSIEQDGVMVSVAKKSAGAKQSVGGAKTITRTVTDYKWVEYLSTTDDAPRGVMPVQTVFVEDGVWLPEPSLEESKEYHAIQRHAYPGVYEVVVNGVQI